MIGACMCCGARSSFGNTCETLCGPCLDALVKWRDAKGYAPSNTCAHHRVRVDEWLTEGAPGAPRVTTDRAAV